MSTNGSHVHVLFLAFFFLFGFSSPSSVRSLYVEKKVTIDLIGSAGKWIVETQPGHIFYITIHQEATGQHSSRNLLNALTIRDASDADGNSILFQSSGADDETSSTKTFYSTESSVIIYFNPLDNKFSVQLTMEKAVNCPSDLGESTTCARIVDPISCYCASFTGRTWQDSKEFCNSNGMDFVAVESQVENEAIWRTWGGQEIWLGGSDLAQEGQFIWDATGGLLSDGYTNWYTGEPNNVNGGEDCIQIGCDNACDTDQGFYWNDGRCSDLFYSVCELQQMPDF